MSPKEWKTCRCEYTVYSIKQICYLHYLFMQLPWVWNRLSVVERTKQQWVTDCDRDRLMKTAAGRQQSKEWTQGKQTEKKMQKAEDNRQVTDTARILVVQLSFTTYSIMRHVSPSMKPTPRHTNTQLPQTAGLSKHVLFQWCCGLTPRNLAGDTRRKGLRK